MAEQRDNSGILSDNDRKEKDQHPDKKGSCTIAGVEYWISGWDKKGCYGPFVSLAFQRKDAAPVRDKRLDTPEAKEMLKEKDSKEQKRFENSFDDDIPF